MLEGKRIAVVVPAHDEAAHIAETVATIPGFVDLVVVVDDASRDATASIVRARFPRAVVIVHRKNRGVGAAIVSGYRAALDHGAEVVAVMAGDGQMHPDDLLPLVQPVARGSVDYAKGNRFAHPTVRARMPRVRYLGGRALARLTSMATGYPIADSQTGFTAISRGALQAIALDRLWPRYGYPNDLLSLLALSGARVREITVRPVYEGQKSGLRPRHFAIILGLLTRAAIRRRSAPSQRGGVARPTCS